MKAIHSLRTVASFALLGAVVSGVLAGWVDYQTIDPRAIGAALGAAVAVGAQMVHAL